MRTVRTPEKQAGQAGPTLSVVVPTLDEARSIVALLADLQKLSLRHEVVVADGGSADATCAVARAAGARVITAPRGRGSQLRAGAAAAAGRLLCFLHADVRLDAPAIAEIERIAALPPTSAYTFRLAIDGGRLAYRAIEWGANLRSTWGGLPYGDQGLLVWREHYDAAGGYPETAIMEDVTLIRSLGRVTNVRMLPAAIRVSARRWARQGVVRRTLGNWCLRLAYRLGASPAWLAERYPPLGDRDPPE